ncbi:Aste57867_17291 [Aphanomyces stellatus]|uniref:Aste57867_17291 protein n=1 Tax=Aphanomyces stellatus TaxID=120398 RepID=A0A485LB20_9STRA|nr:hypothetical protein As57867_017232 [Aphanomyces stellatus]VFT94047.1 Aste57867_17291 [Aphanomyces stellatus]
MQMIQFGGNVLPEISKLYPDVPQGVVVKSVTPGSPAAAAGILPGDVILEFAGTKISSVKDVVSALGFNVGRKMCMKLVREGNSKPLTLCFITRDASDAYSNAATQRSTYSQGVKWLKQSSLRSYSPNWGSTLTGYPLILCKLKPNALAELNLPIQVVKGSIGKVHVLVPWNQLGSASVQITLEGIYGVAIPNSELPSQEEILMGVRNRLERAELIRQHQQQNASAAAGEEETFFSRLTSRILDNLVITIRDFHLRYEDTTSNPTSPFTCGIIMESFTIETTDANEKKIFVDRSQAAPTKTYKVAKLKKLAVYWDKLSSSTVLQKSKDFENDMRNVIYSDFGQKDRRWLLVPPCSLTVRFTKNESLFFTKESPKYRIQATVENLSFHLSREQYEEMLFMYKALTRRMAVEAHFWYNRHRPFLSISNYSIVWWDYAVRFHSKKKKLRFRWSVVRKMARDRKMYIALYKQHHLQKNALKMEQVSFMQKLEDSFPLELIIRLREIAEQQFEAAKSSSQSNQSWYGYFFGDEEKSDVLTDEGKADLKKAFEETVALEEVSIPDDCSILVVELELRKGESGLFS